MKLFYFVLILLLLSGSVYGTFVDESVLQGLENNSSVDVIIRFSDKSEFLKRDFSANSVLSNLNQNEFKGKYYRNANIAGGKISKDGLERLRNNLNVEAIYINHIFKIDLENSTKMINSTIVNSLKVHGMNNLTGKGVGVCVLDTGANYSLGNLGGCFGTGCKVVSGNNYTNNDTRDDNGHGTHVAGIIASKGNLTGVAPDANIISMKVLNSDGSGTEADIISAIKWCTNNSANFSINIISMSFGTGIFDTACDNSFISMRDAINEAVANNISVIAASGNKGDGSQSGGNYTHITSPGCISNVTAVSAIDKNYNIDNSYANRNSLVSLLAPGTSIKSLNYNVGGTCLCGTSACSGEYMTCSGTSMAAPHVAGVYALIRQYLKEENNSLMTNSQIKYVLNSTGTNITDTKTNLTYVLVDSYKALLNLDTHAPELKLSSPLNKTYAFSNISFNFSSIDVTLNSTWYNIDSGNNLTLNSNTTLNLSNGNHIINLYANDTNGNLNSTTVTFLVNTNIPNVVLNEPNDNSTDYDGSVTFNCSATSNVELKNMSLWHNLSGSFVLNQTKNVSGTINYSIFTLNNLNNTKFIWSCLAYNTNETYYFADNFSLTVKINKKPNITSYLPNLTISVDEGKSLSFNHTSTDPDNDTLSYYWLLNGINKSNNQNYTYSPSYTDAGTYSVSLIVSDNVVNTSVNWTVTVNNVIFCGNNIKETGESCDGTDLDSKSCSNLGFTGGSLSCSSSCSFVTNSCTNTSSGGSSGSGSSGGSGGGGTSLSTNEFTDLAPTTNVTTQIPAKIESTSQKTVIQTPVVDETGKSLILIKGETIDFALEGNNHKVTLDVLGLDNVEVTISSDPIKVSLKLNEEKTVDIDNDNVIDMKIKLEKILDGEATLKLTSFKAQAPAKGITGFSIYKNGLNGLKNYMDYIIGVIGFTIILFILVFFIRRDRNKTNIS